MELLRQKLALPFVQDEDAMSVLKSICVKHQIEFEMLIEMLDLELEKRALQRRHGIFSGLNEIILNHIDE